MSVFVCVHVCVCKGCTGGEAYWLEIKPDNTRSKTLPSLRIEGLTEEPLLELSSKVLRQGLGKSCFVLLLVDAVKRADTLPMMPFPPFLMHQRFKVFDFPPPVTHPQVES